MKKILSAIISVLLILFGTALAVNPKSVSFSENEITIDISESNTYTLLGTVYPESSDQSLNWYTSNETMATVTGGVITALRTGDCIIRANVPGITAIGDKCLVHIIDGRIPRSLSIACATDRIEPGESIPLSVSANSARADTTVTWQSSDIRIATVDDNGIVTGVKPGTCYVRAFSVADRNVFASIQITVAYNAKPDSITITAAELSGNALDEFTLGYVITPDNASKSVRFASSDSSVASIDNDGKLTLISLGECDISVSMAGYPAVSSTVHLVVSDPRVPDSINVYPESISIEPYQGEELKPACLPFDKPSEFRYKSLNERVATVSDDGIVTAVSCGNATIRVYSAYTDKVYTDVQVNVYLGKNIKKLYFPEKSITLQKGDTIMAPYSIEPADGSRAIKLISSDESILKVNYDGTITALHYGEAELTAIYARDTGIRSSTHIVVEDLEYPLDFNVYPGESISLAPGESRVISVSVVPDYADNTCVITSSREDIVALDGSNIIAVKRGASDITVTSIANQNLSFTFRVTVDDGTRCLVMPLRRTDIDGIDDNLAMIDAVKQSAYNEINELFEQGIIGELERNGRYKVIDNAFDDYAFPWMVERVQKYWKAENSQDGAKDFKPGIVYYGMPYISGASSLRAFSRANAVTQERYLPVDGEKYYILNQDVDRFGIAYVGTDCSAYVALCLFEYTRVDGEILKTSTLIYDDRLIPIENPADLRPGDIMVRSYAHVVMFLYWADEAHTQAVFIEQGGSEYAINTISTNIYEITYYSENYYYTRRLRDWSKLLHD